MGIINIKALRDWILLRGVNHMLATEKGFFMDARMGPVIQEELDKLKANVGEINSNLGLFGVISVSRPIAMAGDELTVLNLEYPAAVPGKTKIAGAFVSIDSSHIQATIRNVAGTAANVTLKNQSPNAAEGTVYFSVFYIPKL